MAKQKATPTAPVPSRIPPNPTGPGIKELVWVEAGSLAENPDNWRKHSQKQINAVQASVRRNGWAGALLFNRVTQRLIDGHLRRNLKHDEIVPVLVGDWSPEQEREVLLTLDPISALAGEDHDAFTRLIEDYRKSMDKLPEGKIDEALDALLGELKYASDLGSQPGNPLYESAFIPGVPSGGAADEDRILPDTPNEVVDPEQIADLANKSLPRCPTCNQLIRRPSPAPQPD